GVPAGQTLGLVARGVSINPAAPTAATLSAPAGTIHVTSVAPIATGEVPVDPRNVAAFTVTSFGQVDIRGGGSNSRTLDVSDQKSLGSGGSVFIRAGALTVNAGEINADNYGSSAGGMLSLRGDSQVALSGANVHAVAQSAGRGADIVVTTAGSLALTNSSTI